MSTTEPQQPVLAEVRATAASLWSELERPPSTLVVRSGEVEIRLESAPQMINLAPDRAITQPAIAGPAATDPIAVSTPMNGTAMSGAATSNTTTSNGGGPHGDVPVAHIDCVHAPLVGVFYRAPTPDASPFVDVGDRITVGQQVGIIEAMKMMVPIESEVAGQVIQILAENGEPVEYDRPLLAVTSD